MKTNIHYYIDGYNTLFRYSNPSENLKASREQFIEELNKKLSIVSINVSLVFDSYFPIGDATRAHLSHIEIIFSSHGQTADQFIIEALKKYSTTQEVVVTSDKELARLARCLGAKTENVDEFFNGLNQRYKKKLTQLKLRPGVVDRIKKKESVEISSSVDTSTIAPKLSVPERGTIEYYETLFEQRFQDLLKETPVYKKKKSSPLKKTRVKPPLEKKISEFDRWLKLFGE